MGSVRKTKAIRDPVHGDMEFDQFEHNIINTPEFQRMRGIRQLGMGYLVFPGAHHTRFEHSLGVAHMAGRIAEVLRKNCGPDIISDEEIRFVRALGLIHDIGHIPFGHTLEDERPIYSNEFQHDKESRLSLFFKDTQLSKALLDLGNDIEHEDLPNDLLRVMNNTHGGEDTSGKSPREVLLAHIIGNTICSDLLDYLKRDPYFTGIHHSYDEKFLSAFEIRNSEIFLNLQDGNRLRYGVASEILHLLRLRYTLGERVYYHLTKASASAMISKAVELSELPHTVLAKLRDDELLYILENATTGKKVFGCPIKNAKPTADLVKKIRRRCLFIPVYTISRAAAESEHCLDNLVDCFHSPEKLGLRSELENRIARMAGLESHQIIIYCPAKKMSTKTAMVKVLWPKEENPIPLQTLCNERHGIEDENTRMEIQQLQRKHKLLWQLNVFVDAECSNRKLRDVAAYCQVIPEFHSIENHNSEYATSSDESVFDFTLRRAIQECPKGHEVDAQAIQDLVSSDYKGGKDITIKGVQDLILRKSSPSSQREMDFTE